MLSELIQIYTDPDPSHIQGATIAATITQVICPQPRVRGKKDACFICGYFAQGCSAATVKAAQPLSVISTKISSIHKKCREGYHQENKCTFKTDIEDGLFLGNFQ